MSEKIEGTFVLDGLVEGKVPAIPGAEQKLRDWVSFARSAGLRFNIECDGSSFSLLSDNKAASAEAIGPVPAEVVASALREMLKVFPPAERGRVYATLRSAEYQKGREVQTIYRVMPDGSLDAQSRTVEAKTTPPPVPLNRKERFRLAMMGTLVAVGVFGISSLFVDYRGLWRQLREQVTPIKAEQIAVNASVFADYFTIENKKIDGETLVLTLKRTARLPLKMADFDGPATRPSTSFEQRLVLQAIARGYVRVERFGEKGKWQSSGEVRMSPLREKDSIDVVIGISREPRTCRVDLTY